MILRQGRATCENPNYDPILGISRETHHLGDDGDMPKQKNQFVGFRNLFVFCGEPYCLLFLFNTNIQKFFNLIVKRLKFLLKIVLAFYYHSCFHDANADRHRIALRVNSAFVAVYFVNFCSGSLSGSLLVKYTGTVVKICPRRMVCRDRVVLEKHVLAVADNVIVGVIGVGVHNLFLWCVSVKRTFSAWIRNDVIHLSLVRPLIKLFAMRNISVKRHRKILPIMFALLQRSVFSIAYLVLNGHSAGGQSIEFT